MTKPQIIKTPSGDELVVLPREEYELLLARAGDQRAEDSVGARIIRQALAAERRGDEIFLPAEIWDKIEAGTHPIEAIRRFRGMTQVQLAAKAGITQGFLSEIENRRKTGDVSVLKRIAEALAAPLDVVAD
ncbi:helix-turn-helix domain-containing protein [uncultured Alsobacter sp.]|uniref:helix-turn-helix domain-containing protein n=1 Tax=uncultured Alsobacter sp. TaxID=1748258 RepID=UPI0025DAC8F8|nr:helix-turn-helix domain-containing protein [uncultured Alsobacter sp.]